MCEDTQGEDWRLRVHRRTQRSWISKDEKQRKGKALQAQGTDAL